MIFDLIDYVLGLLKMLIYKIVFPKKLKFSIFSKYSSRSQIRIYDSGTVIVGRNAVIRSGSILRVHNNGKINIGDGSGLNNNCLLNAMDTISIGKKTILGQGVKIYDHDHIFNATTDTRYSGFSIDPVIIGDNVWIGSDVIILKGSKVGNNSVIAAGSILNGNIPDNTVFYQRKDNQYSSILKEEI